MNVLELISVLEKFAAPELQEDYDNAGLITGSRDLACTGVICCLDVNLEVLEEAVANKCNLIVAHHPIIFRGLKKINGKNYPLAHVPELPYSRCTSEDGCRCFLSPVIEGLTPRK